MSPSAKELKRKRILIAVAIAMLGLYAWISVSDASSAGQELHRVQQDLADMTRMLADIDRLKQAPKVAALQLESPAEIANRISAARQAARLPQSALIKEQPLDPVRIDRSDFELRATGIDLSAATLPQIMVFCEALRDEDTGTLVRDLTLNEPQSGATGGKQEKWEAQLVLTQLIFSPTSR